MAGGTALVLAAGVAAPVLLTLGAWLVRARWVPAVSVIAALAALAAALVAGGGESAPLAFRWLPELGLELRFELDALAWIYALIAAGIGLAVMVYSTRYMPRHLEDAGLPVAPSAARFHTLLATFMAAMIGLVLAQDLLLAFVFFDLTAVVSYLLIGFEHDDVEARRAALMALLVTGVAALPMLAGVLWLWATYDTLSISALAARVRPGPDLDLALALVAVAALAKSAQVPLQFWLPRAMVAPTPVSAYLHSAAMVAAGVFVLSRLAPLLGRSPHVLAGLVVVGIASVLAGSFAALASTDLKRLLAYSTVAQYGHVLLLLGMMGKKGAAGAALYVLPHALAKSALFLAAGIVSQRTGEHEIGKVGGLARVLPVLAVAAALACATLAGLPLTLGFFKDELLFGAAHEHSPLLTGVAVLAAGLTLAYATRFWAGVFLGPLRAEPRPGPAVLPGVVLALGLLAVAGGLAPSLLAQPLSDAASRMLGEHESLHLSYRWSAEAVMALAAYATGALLLLAGRLRPLLLRAHALAARLSPERAYHAALAALDAVSLRLHRLEVVDLRDRVATIVLPTLLLTAAVLAGTTGAGYSLGGFGASDLPLAAALALTGASAVAAAFARRRLGMILALSAVGYGLAAVYALLGAPGVALVAVAVETVFTLLFVGALVLARRARDEDVGHPRRHLVVAGVSLLVAGGAALATLSVSAPASVAAIHVELAPVAHAKNVVTAVLSDFRGLDTLGEATVILVALAATLMLIRGRNE